MQLEELRTFVTLAEVKNFTKTANKLLMSQPTVSLHIKNLEKEFETELFQRSPKFLKITPSGELLLDRANEIIKIYEKTKRDISEIHHSVKGKLKIGASFTIGEYILPSLLRDFQADHPEIEFEVFIGNTEEIIQLLLTFQIDIGLVESETSDQDLVVVPFLEDELMIVCSNEHPLAEKSTVSVNELQNQSWITREMGSGTRQYFNQMIVKNGLKVKSMLTISSNQGIKETVKNGLGLALLSHRVIEKDVEQSALSIIQLHKQAMKRNFSYLYSPVMQDKKNVNAFIEAIKVKWK